MLPRSTGLSWHRIPPQERGSEDLPNGAPAATFRRVTMSSDPITLQQRLEKLLRTAHADDRLRSEMAQARREFFGSDQPGYVDADDARSMDAAAQRFAEWFLLERPSAVLGAVPLTVLGEPDAADAPLANSRVGLFLVETSGKEPQVRDLEGGERLAVEGIPARLAPGDVLVGRLFALDGGVHTPSIALTVLEGSPQIAVAFQRDVRRLGLERRIDQAELEHLVFQGWAAQRTARLVADDTIPPVERIEADLQALLDSAGMGERHPATAVSQAVRDAGEHPGAVIGPLLDQLAFDSDVDLDRLREVLLVLSNAHRAAAARRATDPPPATPPAGGPAPGTAPPFRPRPGESLGEQLARRFEEGRAANEDTGALFADLERILGETIEDEEDADDATDLDDGDLEPLVREFGWETNAEPADEARLASFIELQRRAPVPRLSVEYLEADDYLRFLLQTWLAAPPGRRVRELEAAWSVVQRFHDWMVDAQHIDLRERLSASRRILVERAGDLHEASVALSGDTAAAADEVQIARVLGRTEDALELAVEDGRSTCWVPADPSSTAALTEGDLLLGALEHCNGERTRFRGAVIVVPVEAEHLLG